MKWNILVLSIWFGIIACPAQNQVNNPLAQPVYLDGNGKWVACNYEVDHNHWNSIKRKSGIGGPTFNVAFADVDDQLTGGFNDPILGEARRFIVESLLSDLAQIVQNQGSADILVLPSESDGTRAPALGSPLFAEVDGITGGFMHYHVITGVDPCSIENCGENQPDMVLVIDFGYNFYVGLGSPAPNQYDLYSFLLRELVHALGILSLIDVDGSSMLSTDTFTFWDALLVSRTGKRVLTGTEFQVSPAVLTGSQGGIAFAGPRTMRRFGSQPPVFTSSSFIPSVSLNYWAPGLPPGSVLNHLVQPGQEARKLKPFETSILSDLGFLTDPVQESSGFRIKTNVDHPTIYLSAVEENEQWTTDIGVINPHTWETECTIYAHSADGWIISHKTVSINGLGMFRGNITELFGALSPAVSWVRVQSSYSVTGYSFVTSRDGKQSYAVNAATRLTSHAYIPHIAQNTSIWFTRVDVVNARVTNTTGQLEVFPQSIALNVNKAFSEDSFDVLDKFQSLPETSWGMARDAESRSSLSGHEVFGRIDGTLQIAGVSLMERPLTVPHFSGSIYFAHIARDVNQFWTGFAYANTTSQEQTATMNIKAWGTGGVLVGEKQIILAANEKKVQLADEFLEGIGSPTDVDWIEVEIQGDVVGLELFGTHDGRRLAGLEAIAQANKRLILPHLDLSNQVWNGVAITNISDQPSSVTIHIYDFSGQEVGTEALPTLAAKSKRIFLLSDLFPLLSESAGWIELIADQEILAFILFGDTAGENMAGVIAQRPPQPLPP